MTWDVRFLRLAQHVAGWSKDPSTKVGAVIVGDRNRIVSIGYNGFPRGIIDHPHRLNDRPTKYKLIAHAERNAMDNAETCLVGCTLYATLVPCSECAKSIIQRGIIRIVAPKMDMDKERMRTWYEDFKVSAIMFAEGGVSVDLLDLEDGDADES